MSRPDPDPPKLLIAGVGNILRGDDGFGIAVLRHLEPELPRWPGVACFESGIAGIALVQELLDGYQGLIILDAVDRGAEPGTVFVLEPDLDVLRASGGDGEPVDLHQADPGGVLRLAAALGVLPQRAWIVGCQAAECDELGAGLSPPVRRGVAAAAAEVRGILDRFAAASGGAHACA